MHRRMIIAVVALAVMASACRAADISGAVQAGELLEFPGIEALQAQFTADAGTPRIILSLSPT